eukprot:m.195897 g.195897  ORF g.195897 m.195897 type:complete len:659 (-) comp19652_c0_seq1:128-2104(-)
MRIPPYRRPGTASSMYRTLVSCLVCLVACAVVPWCHCDARTVYVSSCGNDNASGTSADQAWQTFDKLAASDVGPGDTVYLVSGSVWTEPLTLLGPGAGCAGTMRGFFEGVAVTSPTDVAVRGWVVDPLLPNNGSGPVNVRVEVDGVKVMDAVANESRPDVVKAGEAPNPYHGYDVRLPTAAATALLTGKHRVDVLASGSAPGCGPFAWRLPLNGNGIQCLCDGKACPCSQVPSPPGPLGGAPLVITASDPTARRRPTIFLNGSGTAMTLLGFNSVNVSSIEMAHATEGITASANTMDGGVLNVHDCVFLGVWNRSSIGQILPIKGRNCGNGWTPSVHPANFQNVTVSSCLFDNIDVMMLPGGPLGTVNLIGNTITRANGNTVLMTGHTMWHIAHNVFSRDDAPRFFQCGTTDIMVGQLGSNGIITENEIGWRGEHPASPDGCGIDFEGGSDGVAVTNNLIHDSYGAGIMVFGLSDGSRNISNALISGNTFVRNGARQMSDDRGEIAFMEYGSTGTCTDNVFYSSDPRQAFVLNERRNGTLDFGWTTRNNTIHPLADLLGDMAETPAIANVEYDATGTAHVAIESRVHPPRPTTLLYTTDGSWPQVGAPGTTVTTLGGASSTVAVARTAAVNARFIVPGLLPSLTMTMVVTVPAADYSG